MTRTVSSTLFCSLLSALAAACSGSDSTAGERSDPSQSDGASDGCEGAMLEADRTRDALSGPGVVDGQLASGNYVLSSTYLRLEQDEVTRARFAEVVAPVIADLTRRDGLVAFALSTSESCRTARTLTVWRDETAMIGFAVGEAHLQAAAAIGELSRGGSLAMHWAGTEADANWETAALRIGEFEGQVY